MSNKSLMCSWTHLVLNRYWLLFYCFKTIKNQACLGIDLEFILGPDSNLNYNLRVEIL